MLRLTNAADPMWSAAFCIFGMRGYMSAYYRCAYGSPELAGGFARRWEGGYRPTYIPADRRLGYCTTGDQRQRGNWLSGRQAEVPDQDHGEGCDSQTKVGAEQSGHETAGRPIDHNHPSKHATQIWSGHCSSWRHCSADGFDCPHDDPTHRHCRSNSNDDDHPNHHDPAGHDDHQRSGFVRGRCPQYPRRGPRRGNGDIFRGDRPAGRAGARFAQRDWSAKRNVGLYWSEPGHRPICYPHRRAQ